MKISDEMAAMIGREAAGQNADSYSIEDDGSVYFHAADDDQLGFRHAAGKVRCGRVESDGVVFFHGGYDASKTRIAPREIIGGDK